MNPDLLWHRGVEDAARCVVVDDVGGKVEADTKHGDHVAVFQAVEGDVVVTDLKTLVVMA